MHICKDIKTLEDFHEAFPEIDLPVRVDYHNEPCYQKHLIYTENLPEEIHPGEFLSLFADNCSSKDIILTYSVTDQEDNYKEWVEVAQTIPGATVTVIDRGNRFCYFCCVPTVPNMDMV
jgi:hypothetical protein